MILKHLVVLSIFVVSVFCSIKNNKSNDVNSILEDILKRLDEKEARLNQLETIVRVQETTMHEQQGQITALEEEVAIQKEMKLDLQKKTAVEPKFHGERSEPDEASSNDNMTIGTYNSP